METQTRISRSELDLRLRRIKDYNAYQIAAGQPHHCTSRRELKAALKQWGYPEKIAESILPEPKPSPFLAKTGTVVPVSTDAL